MSKTIVLVAGATGFLGSHILEALVGRADIRLVAACGTHRDSCLVSKTR
jgi:thioester reductase-like protein